MGIWAPSFLFNLSQSGFLFLFFFFFFFFYFFFFSSPHLRCFSRHFASLVVSRKSWLIGALRFARGFKNKCCATPLRGLSGHFASLVFSKKRLPHSSFSLFPLSPFPFSFFFSFFFFLFS